MDIDKAREAAADEIDTIAKAMLRLKDEEVARLKRINARLRIDLKAARNRSRALSKSLQIAKLTATPGSLESVRIAAEQFAWRGELDKVDAVIANVHRELGDIKRAGGC